MSKGGRDRREALAEQADRTAKEVRRFATDGGRLGIVQAPPGSGKTWLLVATVVAARKAKMRVAVAAQTNSQADEICRRLAREDKGWTIIRFAGGTGRPKDLGKNVSWETETKELPSGPTIVVGTAAKWGMVNIFEPFDIVLIDEAWQMGWADFMLLAQVAPNFVLIGDPGQIPPVVTIEVCRWETAPRPPHVAAPQAIVEDRSLNPQRWDLPGTRRLPSDTAALVRPFYDFPFEAFAEPGERQVLLEGKGARLEERALDLLRGGTVVGLTIPTPDTGPPLERDDEIAAIAASVVKQLLRRGARFRINGAARKLDLTDIGIASTHRAMNSALAFALPKEIRNKVAVDTPERWQGLERPVMIIVHPLSGTLRPSAFDLETGRLCVMASRHTAGMIVVSRDHLFDTLAECIPTAAQPFGRKDVEGRGLKDNLEFWTSLLRDGRTVNL